MKIENCIGMEKGLKSDIPTGRFYLKQIAIYTYYLK